MLKTKSVHSAIEASDGLRILAARHRGRGLPNDRYDVWMANLGPSEVLLRQALDGADWSKFSRAYTAQILASGDIDAENKTMKNHEQKFTLRLIKELAQKGNVTLMCHCAEDERRCHRHLLKKLVERA